MSRKSPSAAAAYNATQPYRPLNVRDALTYLDQVKIQFSEQPEVYNRFLDVMKEFKGQVIDTPGVIDRVSTLFRGHPSLIQGFNTFLPPGYRIDCSGTADDQLITVTTPSGTISQVAGRFSAALDQKEREIRERERERERKREAAEAKRNPPSSQALPPLHSHIGSGPPPFQTNGRNTASVLPPATSATSTPASRSTPAITATPSSLPIPPHSQHPAPPSGPSTPSAAQFLASGMTGSHVPTTATPAGTGNRPGAATAGTPPMLEFNHAISFVNKIKNRFNSDPETYKQFLEILQTYQRDTRDIAEVYDQVTKLFNNAPDLIDEFKQFLPENGQGGLGGIGFGTFVQAAAGAPPSEKPAPKRSAAAATTAKDGAPPKKRRGQSAANDTKSQQRKKSIAKADSPSGEDEGSLTLPTNGPQTLASPDEVAFFDKVKKFIDDKVTYHEFLKLINLFVQDMIDVKVLVERAESFLGNSGDVWVNFKRLVGADENGNVGPLPQSAQGGYGFGGMISIDNQVVENTPMLERVKPYLDGPKVKSYGPSYRKLPKTEVNLQCTGRDAMCWEVLNDEWVSHPTWAAEDAAPFMAHKKNVYEEALHKSEEERHEYDYHIEANLRTIALLEPLNNKIQTIDPEERAHFNLKSGLGTQSKSIYQRIIKKVYGKELGPDIIRALHENPVVALPIVLERLKAKDEEWKKAQREWNRVWREQDAKNFYKALDHQGFAFKTSDKKVLSQKSLVAEIEARRREQGNVRATLLDKSPWRSKSQFQFSFTDAEILKDVVKLVISYLDRLNNALSPADKDRIEQHLRDLVPLLFMFDKADFDADFGDAEHGSQDEGSDESDGDGSVADDDDAASTATGKRGGKRGAPAADLRKRLLKQVGEKERGSATPGPEDSEMSETRSEGTPAETRDDTPLPPAADPAAVAEAVEKDKASADASEQTWVQIDTPEHSASGSNHATPSGSESSVPAVPAVLRKANFFANNHYYVLVRLVEVLYTRLKQCKEVAEDLAKDKKRPINPIAIKLGLAEPDTQYYGIEAGENPAQHYYGHLLSMAERLFENEIDAATYEETLRMMFGTKAYIMFTLDRVVGFIVKQTQTVLGDMKSQELFALLQRDRAAEKTTTRQQIAYRMQAEGVLGQDENLYKIEYHPKAEALTIQLLGREDLTIDDARTAQEKWRQYIESFVLTHPTEGLPQRVDQPFLHRSLVEISDQAAADEFITQSGLEIKIALGNYRMFFTPGTEDYFHRKYFSTPAEVVEADAREEGDWEEGKAKLDEFVKAKLGEAEGVGAAAAAAAAAASGSEDGAEAGGADDEMEVDADGGKPVEGVPAAAATGEAKVESGMVAEGSPPTATTTPTEAPAVASAQSS